MNFEISLTNYDQTVTIKKDHSDVTLEELEQILLDLLRAAGWGIEEIELRFKKP